MRSSLQRGTESSSGAGRDEWLALFKAAGDGSCDARGRLLESCRGYLLSVASRGIGEALAGKVGASDLVQDTFTAAHEHFARFNGATEKELLAWLSAILGNLIVTTQRRYLKTEKRDARRELPINLGASSVISGPVLVSDSSSPTEKAIRNEEAQRLEQMLRQLSDEHRRVILLRNWERRTFDEIGQILGRTPNAARKLWVRALARLEEIMVVGTSESDFSN